jgi:glutamate-1-semialdehyde 2,1-aminomutase
MSLKLITELNDTDRKLLNRALDGFVPDKVFDVHTHLFHTRHFAAGKRPVFLDEDRGYGMADFQAAMRLWMPGRDVEGLFFGFPSTGNDRVGENAWVQSQIDVNTNSRALVLAAPTDDPAEVRRLMGTGVFVGIKPYRMYADVPDTKEAEIESFAPEWMWEACHDHDGIMMLHIMLADGITDPRNVEAIQRLCRRYPRCKLVLAHVARSFNYRHAREGLHHLIDIDNVVVDTSAVTQTGAFRAAIEILGPQRVLWGSDYMVSELRGSCITQGDGFTWIHPDLGTDKLTIFGQYTTVGIESLLCLREACEDTGMTQGDLEDIFRENALRLLKLSKPDSWPQSRAGMPRTWNLALHSGKKPKRKSPAAQVCSQSGRIFSILKHGRRISRGRRARAFGISMAGATPTSQAVWEPFCSVMRMTR